MLYCFGKNSASRDDGYRRFFFFSFGSPEPELTFGRLCRHHDPDDADRKVLSAAERANEVRQPEPGCQPAAGGTAALCDVLKAYLRWETRL